MKISTGFSIIFGALLLAACAGICFSQEKPNDSNIVGSADPIVKVEGRYNIMWGDGAGTKVTTGSYNFCLGHGACSELTRDNCIVEVVDPSEIDAAMSSQAQIGNASYAIALAKYQDYVCKDNQNRYLKMQDWFLRMFKLQVEMQEKIHEKDSIKDMN